MRRPFVAAGLPIGWKIIWGCWGADEVRPARASPRPKPGLLRRLSASV